MSRERLDLHAALRRACELAVVVAVSLTAVELLAVERRLASSGETPLPLATIASALSKNLTLQLPLLVIAVATRARPSWRSVGMAGWALLSTLWVGCDAWVRATTGNALWFYAEAATEPGALRYFGGRIDVVDALGGGAWQVPAALAAQLAFAWLASRRGRAPRVSRATAWPWLAAGAALLLAAPVIRQLRPPPGELAGLDPPLLVAGSLWAAAGPAPGGTLDERLSQLYAAHLERASARPTASAVDLALPPDPPDVLVLVADCLRWTMLNPDAMPRLSAWAERGTRFDAMYAAGNMTQHGLFGLLYGRSAVWTPQRGGRAPLILPWGDAMKRAGYELHFVQAASMWWKIGMVVRKADFQIHSLRHGENGLRDRLAAARAREILQRPGPSFVMVLLVAPHAPYPYPTRYTLLRPPDDPAAVARGEAPDCRTAEGEIKRSTVCQRYGKYYRAARFTDDLVSHLLDGLDLERTVVFFTGDHGESFGEDGSHWHGGRLSDVQTRVPGLWLGPGVPAGRVVRHPASGMDLMASVFDLLGVPASRRPVKGRSWLAPPLGEPIVATARYSTGARLATLGLVGEERRYKLRVRRKRPDARFIARMDAREAPVPTPPGREDEQVLDWFRAFLLRESGPQP